MGARLAAAVTVTSKVSVAVPPLPSFAVTVMVAVPALWARTVRLAPPVATDAVATALSEDWAVMVRVSPSASLNTVSRRTRRVSPGSSLLMSAMADATVGARLAAAVTVTSKASDAVPPLPSLAVTVMVAVPALWARTVRLAPPVATDAVATALSDDLAVMVRVSPSGSSNTPDSDTWRVSPGLRSLMSEMADATVAWAFSSSTVTVKVSDTVPPLPSFAVTVMVAVPSPTARTVSAVWAAFSVAVATAFFDEPAVMVSASLSASLNTPDSDTWRVSSGARPSMSASAEATVGALLGSSTVTSKASDTVPSLPSFAVTVTVAVPALTAVTVTLAPPDATDTVATAVSDDSAVTVSVSSSASENTPDSDTWRVSSGARPLTSAMADATVGVLLPPSTVTATV